MKSRKSPWLVSRLQNIFGRSQLVHTKASNTYEPGDLVTLSELGERVFGAGQIGIVLRGPYTCSSFTYDITPLEFPAYDVFLGGNLYKDFAEAYLEPIKENSSGKNSKN